MSSYVDKEFFYYLRGRELLLYKLLGSRNRTRITQTGILQSYHNELMYPDEDITDGLRIEYTALNDPFISESFESSTGYGTGTIFTFTASGRVILTFQDEKERKRRLERRNFYSKLEETSKISVSELKKIEKLFSKNTMKKIERNKYELVKSLQIKGVTNISVPIFDYTNNAIAALTIPFVDRIITKGELSLEQVKKLLVHSAEVLSSEMGFKH